MAYRFGERIAADLQCHNMHRAHGGSFRVRIEARPRVVAASKFPGKADLRTDQRIEGKDIFTRPGWPAAARNLIPLSRFPQGASRGGSVSPHASKHAAMLAAPPTRGLPPPCASPRVSVVSQTCAASENNRALDFSRMGWLRIRILRWSPRRP
jgi:hypothetical protein